MHKERFKIGPYVVIILRKGKKILLIRRYQTGFDDGFYACAGVGLTAMNRLRTPSYVRRMKSLA